MSLLRRLWRYLSARSLKCVPSCGKYEIRNCKYGPNCDLNGNIDKAISKRHFHPEILDEELMFEEASCTRCSMNIRVENDWEEIQVALYLNKPFIVKVAEIEPQKFADSRRKMLLNIDEPLVQPPLRAAPREDSQPKERSRHFEKIRQALIESHVGEGYGNQKAAAELAVEYFGKAWIKKSPQTTEAEEIRESLRKLVEETTPEWHSNHYVIWQRIQKYAKDH